MKIEGMVKKVKYHNDDNGYYILDINISKTESVIVCGTGINVGKHDFISVEGEYSQNKYGVQFNTKIIDVIEPTKEESILTYLSSGIIKGLSKRIAKEMVRLHGANSMNILTDSPELLLRIKGVGEGTLNKIVDSWDIVRPSQNLLSKFSEMGFNDIEALLIYKRFNKRAYNVLNNIYLVSARIKTIGFKRVDELALRNGTPINCPIRILSCINAFLLDEHDSGACIVDYETIFNKVVHYLKINQEEMHF